MVNVEDHHHLGVLAASRFAELAGVGEGAGDRARVARFTQMPRASIAALPFAQVCERTRLWGAAGSAARGSGSIGCDSVSTGTRLTFGLEPLAATEGLADRDQGDAELGERVGGEGGEGDDAPGASALTPAGARRATNRARSAAAGGERGKASPHVGTGVSSTV